MSPSNSTPFAIAAASAFPRSNRALAHAAVSVLSPFIDQTAIGSREHAVVLGEHVEIPYRLNVRASSEIGQSLQDDSLVAVQCLRSRAPSGFVRQEALQLVLTSDHPWAIPFIVLLAGEYVVEITGDLVASLPGINRAPYVNFVRENRPLMSRLRSKAVSYWACYYRGAYPDRNAYPGLRYLHQMELWAS